MERVVSVVNRAVNNDTFISVLLVGCFGALSVRSVNQQNHIEALEAEKDSLVKTNKSIKKTIWDWKQQLFAEADAAPLNALVPLPKLKAIYGEATPPPSALSAGGTGKGDGKSPAAKLVI